MPPWTCNPTFPRSSSRDTSESQIYLCLTSSSSHPFSVRPLEEPRSTWSLLGHCPSCWDTDGERPASSWAETIPNRAPLLFHSNSISRFFWITSNLSLFLRLLLQRPDLRWSRTNLLDLEFGLSENWIHEQPFYLLTHRCTDCNFLDWLFHGCQPWQCSPFFESAEKWAHLSDSRAWSIAAWALSEGSLETRYWSKHQIEGHKYR